MVFSKSRNKRHFYTVKKDNSESPQLDLLKENQHFKLKSLTLLKKWNFSNEHQ